MSRKQIIALVLIGLAAVILIFNSLNSKDVVLNLVFAKPEFPKSLVFLGWMTLGVITGGLLVK